MESFNTEAQSRRDETVGHARRTCRVDAIVSIASGGKESSLSDAFETNASTGNVGLVPSSPGGVAMKGEWQRVKLGDCFEFLSGKAKPKEKGQYPIYGSNGLIGSAPDYVYEDAFVIGRVGAVGEWRDALLPKLMSGRLRVDATEGQGELPVSAAEPLRRGGPFFAAEPLRRGGEVA